MSDLFAPVTHLEHFRRIHGMLGDYHFRRQLDGAHKAELATIRTEFEFVERLIKLNTIHPLDTPLRPGDPLPPHIPGQGGAVAQPLVPAGTEKEMSGFIDMLLEETRK
jgi:hypothetical protein